MHLLLIHMKAPPLSNIRLLLLEKVNRSVAWNYLSILQTMSIANEKISRFL